MSMILLQFIFRRPFQNSLTAFFHFSINALWKSEGMNQICHLWHDNCRVKVIVLYYLVNKC